MRLGARRFQLRFARTSGLSEWAKTARGIKMRFVTAAAAQRHLQKLIKSGTAVSGKVSEYEVGT